MTGTPDEFATKFGFSIRQLFNFLKELKEIGVPVKYSKLKESYYYTKQGRLQFNFIEVTPLKIDDLKKISGGYQILPSFFQTAISFHS
ncbi:MAG: hypothetical protein COB15_03005 [Flavobacteriales bacterium]|nr:MAG: hypothetical protein COB15_03005 [Flavobacteriales bacterium]